MRGQRLREKMQSGQVILSMGLTFDSPAIVEMLGYTDVDDIFLDAEHGPFNEAQCENLIRVADAADKPVIVRVPTNDAHVILRYLDTGASGLVIPHVTTRDDAERAVQAAKFGPRGKRSFGNGRAFAYGARESATDYIARANRETVLIGLFEDVRGIDNVPDILAVDGLDALIVGPFDLSFSMGHPAQPWHPEVQKVVDEVIAASQRAGKPTGLPANDAGQARSHVERGCRFISLGVASLIIDGARVLTSQIRGS